MSCVKRKESSVRGVNKAWIKFPFLLLFERWGKTLVCSADCTYQRGPLKVYFWGSEVAANFPGLLHGML